MLVLTRKIGQKLIINDNIEIVIIETRGEAVKIGINAPKEVSIFREELYEEIKKANMQAASPVSQDDLTKALDLLGGKKPETGSYNDQFKIMINNPKKFNS
jgi:carbon storage regulator